jgi:hypothetical protein
MIDEKAIRSRYEAVRGLLNEAGRRMFAAGEAHTAGYGGVSAVCRAIGIARSTINRGISELAHPRASGDRVRAPGGGRKALSERDATLLEDLRILVEPATMGDPMRPLLWVSKSHAKLAAELRAQGHKICASTIPQLLVKLKYRRQVNRKTKEGSSHPDRNAQFEKINKDARTFQFLNRPVLSVDTKKKENIGEFKNNGSDYRPEGCPDKVKTHDFIDKELGKAVPYGVYDITDNSAWVSVGVDHDTSEFAVNSIGKWHDIMGKERYPDADHMMITADCGGSNGYRVRLWKLKLQELADKKNITITVRHFPPGTSKWNKIEHRLFSAITQNWRGKPLVSRVAIVELIAATTTITGLKVRCEIDKNKYMKGVKVTDAQMDSLNITYDKFHPEWNYTITPRAKPLNKLQT